MCNNLFFNILDLSNNAVFTATKNTEEVVETDSRSRQCVCDKSITRRCGTWCRVQEHFHVLLSAKNTVVVVQILQVCTGVQGMVYSKWEGSSTPDSTSF